MSHRLSNRNFYVTLSLSGQTYLVHVPLNLVTGHHCFRAVRECNGRNAFQQSRMTTLNLVRHAQLMNRDASVNQHAAPRPSHASPLLHPDSTFACPSSRRMLNSQGKNRQPSVPALYSIVSPFQPGRHAKFVAGPRQQAVTCSAQINAATVVVEAPHDTQTPQEVASVFQKLQNGSDIRGIAIAGLTIWCLSSQHSWNYLNVPS